MIKPKQYRKQYTSKKVKMTQWVNIGLIVFMFGIVIHDSFVHNLPFYYILFILGGLIIGHFISKTAKVTFKEGAKVITVGSNLAGIIITLVLIVVRFFAGKLILDEFSIIWTADAIYLFFIGIYYSKIQNIIQQIDEDVYARLFEDK